MYHKNVDSGSHCGDHHTILLLKSNHSNMMKLDCAFECEATFLIDRLLSLLFLDKCVCAANKPDTSRNVNEKKREEADRTHVVFVGADALVLKDSSFTVHCGS